jgi:hypothetical protein
MSDYISCDLLCNSALEMFQMRREMTVIKAWCGHRHDLLVAMCCSAVKVIGDNVASNKVSKPFEWG